MAWLFVPGLEDSNSGSASPVPITPPSVTSRGKQLQWRTFLRAWKRAPWIRRLSGTTWPASTAALGTERWISSLLDSRASRGVLLAGGAAEMTTDGSGRKSPESPKRATCHSSSWKTFQDCLFEEVSTSWSKNLRHWASRWKDLSYFAPPMLVAATSASDSSFWPTAIAHNERGERGQYCLENPKAGQDLETKAKNWPTPDVPSGGHQEQLKTILARGRHGVNLHTAAGNWPTPNANLFQDSEDPTTWEKRRKELQETAKNGKGAGTPLSIAATLWPSPAERDYRYPNLETYEERSDSRKGEQLPNFVEHHFHSPLDPTTPCGTTCWCGCHGCVQRSHRRRLNPLFVNWLMGWPIWWT